MMTSIGIILVLLVAALLAAALFMGGPSGTSV